MNNSTSVGIISDVHGNAVALTSVMTELNAMGIKVVHGLGDWVGYNMASREVLNKVIQAGMSSVAGNHDLLLAGVEDGPASRLARSTIDATRRLLEPTHIDFLASLPVNREVDWPLGRAIMVHGTPKEPVWGYLHKADLPSLSIPDECAMVLTGATHRPLVTMKDDTAIINPGSVGIPRDGDPRASFAVVNTQSGRAEIHRVTYDPSPTAALNAASGMPSIINDYLFLGRASPDPLCIDLSDHEMLDEAAAMMRADGRHVVRNASGMQVNTYFGGSPGLVIIAVLEKDRRLLIRTTSLPSEKASGGMERLLPFTVVEAPDAAWVQLISPGSIEETGASQISQWCNGIERAFAAAVSEVEE